MRYADRDFYVGEYLLGLEPRVPESEFDFWERAAQTVLDDVTFGRLSHVEDPADIPEKVKLCVCELAEWQYAATQTENAVRESADLFIPSGVTYIGGKRTGAATSEEQNNELFPKQRVKRLCASHGRSLSYFFCISRRETRSVLGYHGS